MKRFAALMPLVLVVAIVALGSPMRALHAAEDFTGKWSGTFAPVQPDGSTGSETILLNLTHKGAELTGTAGPNSDQQWAIANGKVDGNDLAFDVVRSDFPPIKFALKYAEGHLKGEANAEQNGQKLTAKIDATRAK